jgi:exopolysaccharide/PEP-CTERM locus tyrosine autokinase
MSIIEQAAKRLEELRNAGVELPSASEQARLVDVQGRRPLAQVAKDAGAAPATAAMPAKRSKVERTLGASAARTVVLDLARLARNGFITPDADPALAQLAAEYRIIKRPLVRIVDAAHGDSAQRANLIMVTSAAPGEGKTFTALNLAMSISMEVDRTVLLVDSDVVRPSVLEYCGLPPAKGLMDVLLAAPGQPVDLGEMLLRTNVPKLTLLPAGSPHPNATELLASEAMERLLEELAQRYSDRIVVFDAPPLLGSPEARVLASRVGQVVLVVEQGRSSKEAVVQAFSALEGCRNVTSVLNKCSTPDQTSLYGRYYGDGPRSRMAET